jgi:CRISPR-associated exonuclease Cas4
VVRAIREMSLDKIPDFADNPKKCEKCSTVQYCLPEETKMLEGERAKEKRVA